MPEGQPTVSKFFGSYVELVKELRPKLQCESWMQVAECLRATKNAYTSLGMVLHEQQRGPLGDEAVPVQQIAILERDSAALRDLLKAKLALQCWPSRFRTRWTTSASKLMSFRQRSRRRSTKIALTSWRPARGRCSRWPRPKGVTAGPSWLVEPVPTTLDDAITRAEQTLLKHVGDAFALAKSDLEQAL